MAYIAKLREAESAAEAEVERLGAEIKRLQGEHYDAQKRFIQAAQALIRAEAEAEMKATP